MDEEAGKTMNELLKTASDKGEMTDFKQLQVEGRHFSPEHIIQKLEKLIAANRKQRIDEVLQGRTFNVATVVEGLVNTGNVSAVMRTAEAFGFQPFHVIDTGGKYKKSERISHGAEKWLNLWRWYDPVSCVQFLQHDGYQVIATALQPDAISLDSIDFTQKTALVLGNEAGGVTQELIDAADKTCYIPMSGFTQSLNISVAAAISLFQAYEQRVNKQGRQGDLTPEQWEYLKALFYLRSVNKSEQILIHGNK